MMIQRCELIYVSEYDQQCRSLSYVKTEQSDTELNNLKEELEVSCVN